MLRKLFDSVRHASSNGSLEAVPEPSDPPALVDPCGPDPIHRPRAAGSNDVAPNAPQPQLDGIQAAIEGLRQELRAALGKVDRSGEIIGRLETENRALKNREIERTQEPLLKGLISLFDDLRSITDRARSRAAAGGATAAGSAAESQLLNSLDVFGRQALELLRRSGAEPFEPRLADRFDASRQEAWETVAIDSRDQDMHIAEVVRFGFEFAGRIIRPAAVKVYRCHAPVTPGS
jgi:molecular chaperone GrpE (heat shock protein)